MNTGNAPMLILDDGDAELIARSLGEDAFRALMHERPGTNLISAITGSLPGGRLVLCVRHFGFSDPHHNGFAALIHHDPAVLFKIAAAVEGDPARHFVRNYQS